MKIRTLKTKDAPLMLEWMHDNCVIGGLRSDFLNMTLEDCLRFIEKASNDDANVHFAVVSDEDEYMGTVSLKEINLENRTAEFAIAVRSSAMGKGFGWFAMKEIINYGFEVLGLESIYWCVSETNKRACKFYDKHFFNRMYDVNGDVAKRYSGISSLRWYIVHKGEDFSFASTKDLLGCKIVKIKTISTDNNGQLSFFEGQKDIPFSIKRIYYITNVREGGKRGFHAHKNLKQLLICPCGKVNLILDNGYSRREVLLDNPSFGILIEKPIWREMQWIDTNSVLFVAASDYYSEEDYLRDYSDFIDFIRTA